DEGVAAGRVDRRRGKRAARVEAGVAGAERDRQRLEAVVVDAVGAEQIGGGADRAGRAEGRGSSAVLLAPEDDEVVAPDAPDEHALRAEALTASAARGGIREQQRLQRRLDGSCRRARRER